MRAVNLLPRDSRASRSVTAQNLPAVVGGGLGFLVVAALAAGYLSASSKVGAAQQELTAAQAQLAATPVPPAPKAQVNSTPTDALSQQAPRLQAVSSALSQRIAWDRVLREFSFVLPTDVWLQSVAMSAPAGGSSDTGTGTSASGFSVTGTTSSYESVARLLSRMYLVPDLEQVTLSQVSGSDKLISFSISAAVKSGAAPAVATPPAAPVAPPAGTSTDSGASS
jgi:Tfp pilus assembly protein PilN